MDHASIEREALLERYVQGHLPAPDEEALEEHVVGCSTCQEDLVAIRGLARGVRSVASQDAARLAVQVGLLARMRRALTGVGTAPGRWGRLAVVALLVAVGLVGGYAVWLNAENSELRTALAARDAGRGPGPETAESEGAPSADVHESDRLAALDRTLPAAVGSVVLLTEVRGAAAEGEESTPTIDPDSLDGPFALAVYILHDPRFTSYRMQVVDGDDRVVWQRSDLVPNAFEALMATFPRSFFPPGSYRVRVFGLPPDGDAVPLESYPFDVS